MDGKIRGKCEYSMAIGSVYFNAEMPQAKQFLLKAAALEPRNGKVWSMLSADAFTRGQIDLSTEYKRKAVVAEPSNANYALSYLMSFEDIDPNDYKQKVYDFVKRFPTNEQGAQALYWLGEDAKNIDDRINYFEELRKLYPPQKFNWSASGMIHLADDYLQKDPKKAMALIAGMGEGKDWTIRKQVAESLIMIDKLDTNRNYREAIIELDKIKLPSFNYINDFLALKKAAFEEKAGEVEVAYDCLTAKFAKLPTDRFR